MKSRREHTKSNSKPENIEIAVEEFGRKAELPASNTTISSPITSVEGKHRYRRFTFSLTQEISQHIDELSLTAARVSRSDIVKAGILALTTLPEEDLKRLLLEAKSS
jgi:hypothetical protein